MRIKLTFHLDKPVLPKDNKSIWISFLKSVLTSCNGGQFYSRYVDKPYLKDYTFSILLPNPIYTEDTIILDDNRITMLFSADDRNNSGFIFFSAFIEAKNNKKRFPVYNYNRFYIDQITKIPEQEIVGSSVIFSTVPGSGLCVMHHDRETFKNQFYKFSDPEFLPTLQQVIVNEAERAGFPRKIAEQVKVTPLDCKKRVIKQYSIYVVVSQGYFLVEGDPRLLSYFHKAGLGSKHGMGYGMVNLVSQAC